MQLSTIQEIFMRNIEWGYCLFSSCYGLRIILCIRGRYLYLAFLLYVQRSINCTQLRGMRTRKEIDITYIFLNHGEWKSIYDNINRQTRIKSSLIGKFIFLNLYKFWWIVDIFACFDVQVALKCVASLFSLRQQTMLSMSKESKQTRLDKF